MTPRGPASESKSLAEQIRDYHEWHRLTDASIPPETVDIEYAARKNRLVVVVGGPGSGKSTLLRRLVSGCSAEGKVVLRVSLRAMALRMSKGETFNEALIAVASDGFSSLTGALGRLLGEALYLLADGLDEADPNRADLADCLGRWALADENRHIVVTTRPIGHNSVWFEGWEHFELLPLEKSDVEDFAETVYDLLHPKNPEEAKLNSSCFLKELDRSRMTSVAARNPQLLGFLIALYAGGYDIAGNRFRLFSNIVEKTREQRVPGRLFQQMMDVPTAYRALEWVGWLLLHRSGVSESELVQELGQHLATELSMQPLHGQQVASRALDFWEERGC